MNSLTKIIFFGFVFAVFTGMFTVITNSGSAQAEQIKKPALDRTALSQKDLGEFPFLDPNIH